MDNMIIDEISNEQEREYCKWEKDGEYSDYEAECGFMFTFSDDRVLVTENDFNYCPSCGRKIKEGF